MSTLEGLRDKFMRVRNSRSRSRSIVLYLCFVAISTVLWCFVTFNNTITMEMEIPVTVTSTPTDVHFITPVPDTLTITVSARGTTFLKYFFMPTPTLKLPFSEFSDGNGIFRIDAAQLKKAIGKILTQSTTVHNVLPGELSARYTDLPGKLVPVILDMDVEAAPFYALTGVVDRSQDSVLVYSDSKTLREISEVYTYHFREVGLTDTLTRKVTLAPIKGAVIEPRSIEVTIPVERMLTKTQKVQISVRNAPDDVHVVVFPSTVNATFRVPLSYFNNRSNNTVITAVVDYNSINLSTPGNKVELFVGECPGAFEDVKLALDSVEYIIEKH